VIGSSHKIVLLKYGGKTSQREKNQFGAPLAKGAYVALRVVYGGWRPMETKTSDQSDGHDVLPQTRQNFVDGSIAQNLKSRKSHSNFPFRRVCDHSICGNWYDLCLMRKVSNAEAQD